MCIFRTSLLIPALIGALLILCFQPAFCDDAEEVYQALLKNQPPESEVINKKTEISGPWALIHYRTVTKEGGFSGTALFKKVDDQWALESYSGKGPTVDFLRLSEVPRVHWEKLLGKESIRKLAPVLTTIHREHPDNYFIRSARIAGGWAFGEWSLKEDGEIAAEGGVLLKKGKNGWKILEFSGGAIGEGILKMKGVPARLVKTLLGEDEK